MTEFRKTRSLLTAGFTLDDTGKGIPGGTKPFPLSQIEEQRWNVLRKDLPLPLMVLKRAI